MSPLKGINWRTLKGIGLGLVRSKLRDEMAAEHAAFMRRVGELHDTLIAVERQQHDILTLLEVLHRELDALRESVKRQ